ncbi:MAG TPA: hypothetical protein VGU23_08815, partial [Acidobacteriaceae bacterium]|nr:hypothetical protein [Acidobacteriaceae bacterium]
QLFELEDLPWFPHTIRDLATDYLHFIETRLSLHKPVLPLLQIMLDTSKTTSIVDLCSGGGGPVLALYQSLAEKGIHVQFTLTDKFPNLAAFERISSGYPSSIRYIAASIDATGVPPTLVGIRTMFNAFHHFAPAAARRILEDAVDAQQPIAIFEIPERSLLLMFLFFFTPIYVALATPFIRPFRWRRLLWTYLIPAIPLTCWWDGLISACRAYTVAEMLAMTQGLDRYDWKAGRIALPGKTGHLTSLRGTPCTPPAGESPV